MGAMSIDALVVYSFRFNAVRYLSGFYPDYSVSNSGLLVVPRDGEPTLFTRVPGHIDTSRRLSVLSDVRVCKGSTTGSGDLDALAEDCVELLADRGLARGVIGLAGYIPERGIEWPLRRLLDNRAKIVEGNQILDSLRQIKSENELKLTMKSAEIGNRAYDAALDSVREGLWEPKLSSTAEHEMLEQGAEAAHVHFGMLEGSKRYHVPFERNMKRGDRYILEVIPRYKGYTTETAGTFAIGEAPDELKEIHDDATTVYYGAADLIEPGVTSFGSLVKSVTLSLKKPPPRDGGWFRLGHGMGLDNLEKPESLSESDDAIIKPGMVLAIHPYYQVPGLTQMIWGGTYLINGDGAEAYNKSRTTFVC